jgi:outer membrane protein TolC
MTAASSFFTLLMVTFLSAEPPLTEERAVEMALRNNSALSAASHRVEETHALEDAANRWNNPELRVQNLRSDHLLEPAIHGSSYPNHPFEKAAIGLRWSPPELGQRTEWRAEADLHTSQASAELALSQRSTAARVRALHATVLSLDAQLAVARDAQEDRERTRRILQRRVEQQAATIVEQSAAEVDFLDALATTQDLQIQRQQAYDDLLVQLGLPPETVIALSGEGAGRCTPPADATALRALAEKNDLRLNVFQAELDAVEAERSRRWFQLVPWPSYVQLSYVLRGDNDPAYWTFQFGITLPLFDWKSADRRALVAKQARIEDERRAKVAEIDQQLRRALARQAEQAALVQRYREAASILEEALKRFGRGGEATGALQAGQLRARVLAARRAHLRAELECRLEQIEIERLVGSGA